MLAGFMATLSGCGGGEITVEEFCAAREESGCLEMRGETYDYCVTIEASSWDRAEETGCQSAHQTAVACLLDEVAAGGCPGAGSSETCGTQLQAVVDCFNAP